MDINHQLIEACIKKERKAQFELYNLCFGVLMGVCMRYHNNREDAEEVLNQGFLKILNGLEKYKPTVPFEAWIRRIMINTTIDEFRKNKKGNETIIYRDLQEESIQTVDFNKADKQYNAEELQLMIQQLPDMSQKVFNLFAIDGYSHGEIANMLSISGGTSKWHVSFARKELRKMIKKND